MDRPSRRGASKAAKAEAAASKLKQLKEKGGKGRLDDIEEAEDKAVYDVVRARVLQYVVFDSPLARIAPIRSWRWRPRLVNPLHALARVARAPPMKRTLISHRKLQIFPVPRKATDRPAPRNPVESGHR